MKMNIVWVILYIVNSVLACDSTFDRNRCYCFGWLTDCKNNELNSIPSVLNEGNAPHVRSMDFRNNNITAIKDGDLTSLASLEILDLRENPLRCCDILPLKDLMDSNSNLQTVLGTCIGEDNNTYSVTQFAVFPTCPIVSDYCINVTCMHGGTCENGNRMFQCVCPPHFTGKMCELEICQPFPADVVFVIDSSTSQSEEYFNMSKEYILSLTRKWDISLNHFQVAIVSFADNAVTELQFDEQLTNLTLATAIKSLNQSGGSSEIMSGINTANNLLNAKYVHSNYAQPKKYVIALTDGLPSTPTRIRLNNVPDITTIAVSVGYDVSHYFLKTITGDMSLVFPSHPERLCNYLMSELIEPSCNSCQMSYKSDILIAVDVTVGRTQLTKTVPDIINDILPKLTLSPSSTQLAMTTYDTSNNLRFKFSDYYESSRRDLQKQMSTYIPSDAKYSNITNLLLHINQVLFDTTFDSRDDAKKMVLIISNFEQPVETNAMQLLKSLKDADVEIFTIGLSSSDASFDTMSVIASSSFHIGVLGNIYTSMIDTFIEVFVEQLHSINCNL